MYYSHLHSAARCEYGEALGTLLPENSDLSIKLKLGGWFSITASTVIASGVVELAVSTPPAHGTTAKGRAIRDWCVPGAYLSKCAEINEQLQSAALFRLAASNPPQHGACAFAATPTLGKNQPPPQGARASGYSRKLRCIGRIADCIYLCPKKICRL